MAANMQARSAPGEGVSAKPSRAQRRWLQSGLTQPGGKLPLFDADGQRISGRTVRSCIDLGWAEPWFDNPLKPDWIVCKLTHLGRVVAEEDGWAAD
jgi:hypothetical protein